MILHVIFKNLFDQAQFKNELVSTEYLKEYGVAATSISSIYCQIALERYYPYGRSNIIKDIKSIGLHKQMWSKQRINGHTKSIYY